MTWLQGKDGSYGTSLALGTAQDPGCDVLLAYKQNGRRLAPDHVSPILECDILDPLTLSSS